MPFSERRAEVAKDFLIAQGVSADHIETEGRGEDQDLADDQVKQLVEQNPELNEAERQKALEKLHTLVLANNRRVDISLSTTGQESSQQYPFKRKISRPWSTEMASTKKSSRWRQKKRRSRTDEELSGVSAQESVVLDRACTWYNTIYAT